MIQTILKQLRCKFTRKPKNNIFKDNAPSRLRSGKSVSLFTVSPKNTSELFTIFAFFSLSQAQKHHHLPQTPWYSNPLYQVPVKFQEPDTKIIIKIKTLFVASSLSKRK
jgi:hypothetical protein